MNLTLFDLRLLVIFDTLITERSVTRTAQKLGITQPGVSNALGRLRHLFGDTLFIRAPGGMRPTPRALELAVPVSEALRQLESAIQPARFVPQQSTRSFRLAMTPHSATLILPPLMERLSRTAPEVKVNVVPRVALRAAAMLDNNEVDFVIGVAGSLPNRFARIELFEDRFLCVMRPDHQLAQGEITLERFLAARHCAIAAVGESPILFDELLSEQGVRRKSAIIVNEYLAGARIIGQTDMVTGMLSRIFCIVEGLRDSGLIGRVLPLRAVKVSLLWHPGLSNHPAHDWMRQQIAEICREFGSPDWVEQAPAEQS